MRGPATAISGSAPSTDSAWASTRDVWRGRPWRTRLVIAGDYVFAAAEPPKLLLTWIPCGFRKNSVFMENRPPPLLVRSNMKLPVVVNTDRMAFGFVLVASMVNVPPGPGPGFHCAFLMTTLSFAGGVPGATVTVVVAVFPNQVAVRLTVVRWLTNLVITWNVPLAVN